MQSKSRTEEHVLEHDGLLGQAAKVGVWEQPQVPRDGLLFNARPCEVDVEEEEEDAEPDDGWLFITFSRQSIQSGARKCNIHQIDPDRASACCAASAYTPNGAHHSTSASPYTAGAKATHLWFDQDQIDKQDDVVMLDIFVAEAPAVLADREPDVVAARLVAAGVGVLCP